MEHAHKHCLLLRPCPANKTIPERPAKHKLNTNTTHTLHKNSLELNPRTTTSLTHSKPKLSLLHPSHPNKSHKERLTSVFGMLDHKKKIQYTDSPPSCFCSRSPALSPSPNSPLHPSLPSLPGPPQTTAPTTQSTLPLRPTKRGLSEHFFFSPTSQTSKPFSVSIEGANPMLGSLFSSVHAVSLVREFAVSIEGAKPMLEGKHILP